MPKPLHSTEVTQRQDIQFKDFGVLNDGKQGKAAVLTSVVANGLLVLFAIIIGLSAKHYIKPPVEKVTLVDPALAKPPAPLPPPPPPRIVPPPPVVPKALMEPPKIKLPDVKIPDPPKPVEVKMEPKPMPVMTPAPPKAVVAAAAPRPTTVNLGHAASVVNNDPHPSAVALGHADNPIHPSNMPATASVNLGQRGLSGMPAGNTGGGPPSRSVNLGSGQPNGSLNGGGARAVAGVSLGVRNGTPGGHGNATGTRPEEVALGRTPPPLGRPTPSLAHAPASRPPQVLFKPRPQYTPEATAAHVEGNVSIRIHVASNGAVSVMGITNGLGHGLDESARRAILATRFKPATDLSGNPVDWDGVVNVSFQLAS
jgi:protein TonB